VCLSRVVVVLIFAQRCAKNVRYNCGLPIGPVLILNGKMFAKCESVHNIYQRSVPIHEIAMQLINNRAALQCEVRIEPGFHYKVVLFLLVLIVHFIF
jgi:hypothetical protein